MQIGVIDTDGKFNNDFFSRKKIKICRYNKGYKAISTHYPFSHAEYICSIIFLKILKLK